MSLASLAVLLARSSRAGPTPQPVVPSPFRWALVLSCTECFSSIIEACWSTPMRFFTFVNSTSSRNFATWTLAPAPISKRHFGFRKAAGTMCNAYFLPSIQTVCAAFTEPVLTQKSSLSLRAKYEIIFPLPSSPQKAPTITVHGIPEFHHWKGSVRELFNLVDVFVPIISLAVYFHFVSISSRWNVALLK